MQGTGLFLYGPVLLMIRFKQEATLSPATARAVFLLHLAYQVREGRDTKRGVWQKGGGVCLMSEYVRGCGV